MPCIKMPSCAHAAATPCNHYVGLQFCCLGCGLFDMIGGKQTCGLQVRSTFNPPEAVRAQRRHRSQVRILSAVPRRRKLCIACDDIFMLCIQMSSCAHAAATPSKIATTMLGCNFAVWGADFLTCLQGIKLAAFRCEARLIRRRLCGAQRRHRSQVRILSARTT